MLCMECVVGDCASSSVGFQRESAEMEEGRLQLADVSVRAFPEFSADVGEGLCEGAIGRSSWGPLRKSCSGAKPVHIDPGFASDGDRLCQEVMIV